MNNRKNPPKFPPVKPQDIPASLRGLARWAPWRAVWNGSRWTKQPKGSTKDPSSRMTLKAALAERLDGVGLVFTGRIVGDDGAVLIALDLDACIDPETGDVADWAKKICKAAGTTYIEKNPSGLGLRVLLWVLDLPMRFVRSKVPLPHPPVNGKQPEVQLFGSGSAQFASITGQTLLAHVTDVKTVWNIDELVKVCGFQTSEEPVEEQLPTGTGDKPGLDTVENRLAPELRELVLKADWQPHVPDNDKSASAVYWKAVIAVLTAAQGHGDVALDFLLHRTDWGTGLIDGSAEPERYASKRWVTGEIVRAASKTDANPAAVFDDGFNCESFAPPAVPSEVLQAVGEANEKRGGDDAAASEANAPQPYRRRGILDLFDDPLPTWRVDGVIPDAKVGLIAGDSGTGKSGVSLDLALRLWLGMDWLGRPTEPGSVAWFAGEGFDDLSPRTKAWQLANDVEIEPPTGRYFEPIDDTVEGLATERGFERFKLTLRAMAEEHGHPPAVVVCDTLATLAGLDSEIDPAETGAWIKSLHDVVREFRCTIIVVHHLNKLPPQRNKNGKRQRDVPTLDRLRGGSAIGANADFVLGLAIGDEKVVDRVELWNVKQRGARQGVHVANFLLTGHEVGEDARGRPIDALAVLREDPAQQARRQAQEGEEEKAAEAEKKAVRRRKLLRNVLRIEAELDKAVADAKAAGREPPDQGWNKSDSYANAGFKRNFGPPLFEAALREGLFERHPESTKSKPRYRLTDEGRELAEEADDE